MTRHAHPLARWLPLALMLGIGLNGIRLRRRLRSLATLEPADGPVAPRHRFVTAAGVDLGPATRRAASAFAVREGLEVVDLVPGDLQVDRALDLAGTVEIAAFRSDRLVPGIGACHALLADADVLQRAGIEAREDLDPVELADVTSQLKRYAPASTDLAVAPGLRAAPDDLDKRLALVRAIHSSLPGRVSPAWAWLVAIRPGIGYAGLATGVVANPAIGIVAAALWCTQPYLVLAGGGVPLTPRDLHRATLLRAVRDPLRRLRTLRGRWRPPAPPDPFERRPAYTVELAAGTDRFLEPRRDHCPWCGSDSLAKLRSSPDLIQGKPGRFTLERCGECGHTFQNPRLSLAGLGFYYRDFYDGLGEKAVEAHFATLGRQYRQRAEMLKRFTTPKAWLDIGAGHGHFCNVARDTWPQTVFDGLDMSSSIEEAERRRWVDRAYRGQFPELAGELAGRYDVASMHHYLEHTREPLAELDAAAELLGAGGYLLIEVPNPETRFGRVLGRWWMPWFQPQHQHLPPVHNLLQALQDRGFTKVAVDRGRAHMANDFGWAAMLVLNTVAPNPHRPWRPGDPTPWRQFLCAAVWIAGVPLIVGGRLIDVLLGTAVRRTEGGNAYRVLVRKEAGRSLLC